MNAGRTDPHVLRLARFNTRSVTGHSPERGGTAWPLYAKGAPSIVSHSESDRNRSAVIGYSEGTGYRSRFVHVQGAVMKVFVNGEAGGTA